MAQWLPEIFSEPVVGQALRGDVVIPNNPDAHKSVAEAVAEFDAEQQVSHNQATLPQGVPTRQVPDRNASVNRYRTPKKRAPSR